MGTHRQRNLYALQRSPLMALSIQDPAVAHHSLKRMDDSSGIVGQLLDLDGHQW